MKDWVENERPDYLDVAFTSERSVEDEVDRVSKAEINTIVISYAVMFIYIAISLGRIRSFKTLMVIDFLQVLSFFFGIFCTPFFIAITILALFFCRWIVKLCLELLVYL